MKKKIFNIIFRLKKRGLKTDSTTKFNKTLDLRKKWVVNPSVDCQKKRRRNCLKVKINHTFIICERKTLERLGKTIFYYFRKLSSSWVKKSQSLQKLSQHKNWRIFIFCFIVIEIISHVAKKSSFYSDERWEYFARK